MCPRLRSPLASIATLLLLTALAVLLGGCAGDDGTGPDGPAVTATGPGEPGTSTAADDTDPETDDDGSDDDGTEPGTSAAPHPDDALRAVCAPYALMVEAIQDAAITGADPDEIAAQIAPVMKKFAREIADLDRPSSMPPLVWAGVEALAARILKLPERPTDAEIEAVERELTAEERDAVQAAAGWFRTSCVDA